MTRQELHDSILDGFALENVSTKDLRSLVQDFDIDFQPDFELVWCPVWHELDVREHRKQKTQDDVNKMFDTLKRKKVKIKKDFF